jgi:hypothetical protein
VKDVHAAEPLPSDRGELLAFTLVENVGLVRARLTAFLLDHVDGVLRRTQVAVDDEDARTLTSEDQCCRAAVPDRLSRRLTAADYDCVLALESP